MSVLEEKITPWAVGGKSGSVRMGTFPLPGLGHKPQYKNNLRLNVWALSGPVWTSSPHPLLALSSHLSCYPHPPTFLELFHSVPTPGEKMLFPLLVPFPELFQSKPSLPAASDLSILKPCLSFPWAPQTLPLFLHASSPLFFSHVLILSCVHVFVLLLPCPKVNLPSTLPHASSPSVASNRGQEEGQGPHLSPLPLFCPSNHAGLSVLGFSEKLGPPGASQRRLVPVAPALLQPPPAPVGLCGSTPSLRLPASPQLLPPPHPRAREQEQNFT